MQTWVLGATALAAAAIAVGIAAVVDQTTGVQPFSGLGCFEPAGRSDTEAGDL